MNKYILFGCAAINTLLLLNYCLWFIGASTLASWLCVPLVLFGVLFLFFCVFRYEFSLWPIPAFLLVLLLISLSTPAVAWDARSIWLFHAKRIFIDGSLFAQLDNYAPWSHNDYPVIIPAFSASLAGLVGLWNEIFPKTACIVFLVVPIFLIGLVMRNVVAIVFFLITLIYICSHYLHNGFVDTNVAIILTSVVFIVFNISNSDDRYKSLLFYIIMSSLAVLCLVKNEGVLLVVIYLVLFCVYNYFCRLTRFSNLFLISAIPFVFIFSWKYLCFFYNVKNDLINVDLLLKVQSRISDLNSIVLILNYLFYEIWSVAILVLGLIALVLKRNDVRQKIIFTLFIVFSYIICIFAVYILSPHDLNWHLNTSASRVLMSANVLSVGVVLYVVYTFLNDIALQNAKS